MKKAVIISIIVLFVQFESFAQLQRVEIAGSHVQKLTSSITNQEYELQIFLPSDYEKTNKKYPVVYLMDSQWDFPLVTAIYGEQYYDGFIPEMIIVGVTWGGMNPNPDSLRGRDYTPSNIKGNPQSGGAARFLSFMKNELIPYIEKNYKADNGDRTLMGCSLGGLFTLFALFSEPGLFQKYISTTPAFGWDNNVIYQYEKAYFEKGSTAPAKLYMTFGEVESTLPGFKKLADHLTGRNYKSLQIKMRVLENTGHSGNKAEGYARGLQYVFERPSLQLDKELLKKYEGVYRIGNDHTIHIRSENGGLTIFSDPNDKRILHAASETDFYSKSMFLKINFKKDKEQISGFNLELFGNTHFATRVQ
jgi:predicted alpha/beta superfamily hydrolase